MDNIEVVLITGASVDGKVTLGSGESSKQFATLLAPPMSKPLLDLRAWADAVIVGRKTVETDNPSLKLTSSPSLVRIVIDRKLRLPLNRHFFDGSAKTLVVTTNPNPVKLSRLQKRDIELIQIPQNNFFNNLKEELRKRKLQKIMVEGGGNLNSILLQNKFVDRLVVAIFPFIIGGKNTPTIVDGPRITTPSEATKLELIKSEVLEGHMIVNSYKVLYD